MALAWGALDIGESETAWSLCRCPGRTKEVSIEDSVLVEWCSFSTGLRTFVAGVSWLTAIVANRVLDQPRRRSIIWSRRSQSNISTWWGWSISTVVLDLGQ